MKKKIQLTESQLRNVIKSAIVEEIKHQNRVNSINEEFTNTFNGGYNAPRVYEWEVNDGNVEAIIDMRCNIEDAIDSLRFVLKEGVAKGLYSYACFGPDTGETGDIFNISLTLYFRDDINKRVKCDLKFEADFYREEDEYSRPSVLIRDMRVKEFNITLDSYEDDPEFEEKLKQLKYEVRIKNALDDLKDTTIE